MTKQRHHRRGARTSVEHQLAEIAALAHGAEHHLLAVLVAHVHLDAAGEQDVERVGLVALVDDHSVLGIRTQGAVGRELLQRVLAESGQWADAHRHRVRQRHGVLPGDCQA
jgi:hypothetical protein